MHAAALLVLAGSLLALAGCASELDECGKAYPAGSAAYKTCRNTVLQRQNAEQDRQLRLDFRGKQ